MTTWQYDSDGNVAWKTEPGNAKTAFIVDALYRPTLTRDAGNQIVQATYAGPGETTAAPLQENTQVFQDWWHHETITQDALGHETDTIYDPAGRVASEEKPGGRITVDAYDAQGRLRQETYPDPDGSGPLPAPITRYEYDAAGNLHKRMEVIDATTTPPVTRDTVYDYDTWHRTIRETLPDPDGTGPIPPPRDGIPVRRGRQSAQGHRSDRRHRHSAGDAGNGVRIRRTQFKCGSS